MFPHYLVLVAYWLFIFPDRLVETYEKWKEMEVETPHLSKMMKYVFKSLSDYFGME